jgi:hypothetical protein
MRKRLVSFVVATAVVASSAAVAAPSASAATWCYDAYWGWYPCSFSYGVSAVQPVTSVLGGVLPSPASITGLLVPAPQ